MSILGKAKRDLDRADRAAKYLEEQQGSEESAQLTGDTGDTGDNGENARAPASPVGNRAPGTPGAFDVRDDGLYYLPPEGPSEAQCIASPLHVTAMTRNADGEAWGRLLEFRDQDGQLHQWACPMELLAGDCSEFRRVLLSMGLTIAPGQKARNLLTQYVQTAKVDARAVCTDRTGWHDSVFVLPDETICEGSERVLLQTFGDPPKMRQAGTAESWRDEIGQLCVGNSRLLVSVSAAFAAPLVYLLGDESGGLHLVGASSTGKTTALRVAASVWGGPEYMHRWRATDNGLEAVAAGHNDALLVLDELAQVEPRRAGEVAYMLANGTGKHRARRDGLARRAMTWRLLFLSAGEIGLADHMLDAGRLARAGQEVRLADIPADAGAGIYETLHDRKDGAALSDELTRAVSEHYGTPAREYLRELTSLPLSELTERTRKLRETFIAEHIPQGSDGQARRVAGRFALIAAGGELATRMGLTGWPEGEAINGAAVCFKAWLSRRGGPGSYEDGDALSRVRHFLEAHGDARFASDSSNYNKRVIPNQAGYRRERDGETVYFITPEVFKNEVCKGVNYRQVASVLRDRGLLITEEAGRLAVKRRIIGRCYGVRDAIHEG